MSRLVPIAVLLLACASSLVGQAQRPRFQHERAIEVASSGPQRLDVDVALLAGAQPMRVERSTGLRVIGAGGLQDLRLYTSAGTEVPYLLVPPSPSGPKWESARVLPVASTQKTSGFEVDLGGIRSISAIDWSFVPAPFLKRFILEGSGDRQRWTTLVAEGTSFSLPAEDLRYTNIEFAPGDYRYLRVTWDDTNSARVQGPDHVLVAHVMAARPGPKLQIPLVVERRPSEPRRSRFRLALPAGHFPVVALELNVGGGYLLREARVLEARLDGQAVRPEEIGTRTLKRVVRDGAAADALRIPIRSPQEAQLDLVVEDGDNPPLDLLGVTAVSAELPWIYFESEAGTLTARYGDAKLTAPRYDLEAARRELPQVSHTPMWGPARALASVDEPARVEMPSTGSTLDAARFSYSRVIPSGSAGLVVVPLDAAVLAHSASIGAGFRDVRVLDASGQQVPYLLESRDEPIALDVKIERQDLPAEIAPASRHTAYVVNMPYRKLAAARLVVRTGARVFQRQVTLALRMQPGAGERTLPPLLTLEQRKWVHANADTPAPAFVVGLPNERQGDLVLIIEEGDNQPLPIDKATVLMPSFAVRFFRRADLPLRLVYGQQGLTPPQYDLALLAPQVLGRAAQEVHPGVEQAPAASASSSTPASELVSPSVFWVSLSLAVIVLLGIVVRLVRRDVSSEAGG